MTWSKIVSYLINLICSSVVWYGAVFFNVDIKVSAGIYVLYYLAYLYISDLLTQKDKGSSISKAKEEIQNLKNDIERYKRSMLSVANQLTICLANDQGKSSIKLTIASVINELSKENVDLPVSNDPSEIAEPEITKKNREDIAAMDLFIAGQTRD